MVKVAKYRKGKRVNRDPTSIYSSKDVSSYAKKSLYEVITGPCRFYMDVDSYSSDPLPYLIRTLKDKGNVKIFSASRKCVEMDKISYHVIILDRVYNCGLCVKEEINKWFEDTAFFDFNVFKQQGSEQLFRLPWFSKEDLETKEIIEDSALKDINSSLLVDNVEDYFVTCFDKDIKIRRKCSLCKTFSEDSEDEPGVPAEGNKPEGNTLRELTNNIILQYIFTSKQEFTDWISNTLTKFVKVILLENIVVFVHPDKFVTYTLNNLPELLHFRYKVSGSKKSNQLINLSLRETIRNFQKYFDVYQELSFKPFKQERTEEDNFNLWKGLKAQQVATVDMSLIQELLDFLKDVWCNGNEISFKVLLSWFRSVFQGKKARKILYLFNRVQQVACKSSILTFIIEHVIGKLYAVEELGLNSLGNKFNSDHQNKLLIVFDEVTSSDNMSNKSISDTLKNYATSSVKTFEIKGGRRYQLDDYSSIVLTTNNPQTIRFEEGDARYIVLPCSDKYKNDREYLRVFYRNHFNSSSTQSIANHFYSYVLSREDLEDFHLKVHGIDYESEDAKDLRALSLNSSLKFFREFLQDPEGVQNDLVSSQYNYIQTITPKEGKPFFFISKKDAFTLYKLWVKDSNNSFSQSKEKFCVEGNSLTKSKPELISNYRTPTSKGWKLTPK